MGMNMKLKTCQGDVVYPIHPIFLLMILWIICTLLPLEMLYVHSHTSLYAFPILVTLFSHLSAYNIYAIEPALKVASAHIYSPLQVKYYVICNI